MYAYLKRLGYVVTRANPPDSNYPTPPPRVEASASLSIMQRISRTFSRCISTTIRTLLGGFNWWRPVCISRWLHHDKNYRQSWPPLRLFRWSKLCHSFSFSVSQVYSLGSWSTFTSIIIHGKGQRSNRLSHILQCVQTIDPIQKVKPTST